MMTFTILTMDSLSGWLFLSMNSLKEVTPLLIPGLNRLYYLSLMIRISLISLRDLIPEPFVKTDSKDGLTRPLIRVPCLLSLTWLFYLASVMLSFLSMSRRFRQRVIFCLHVETSTTFPVLLHINARLLLFIFRVI